MRQRFMWPGAVLLLCPFMALAQEDKEPASRSVNDSSVQRKAVLALRERSEQETRLYEEIEIMRRILDSGLRRASRASMDYFLSDGRTRTGDEVAAAYGYLVGNAADYGSNNRTWSEVLTQPRGNWTPSDANRRADHHDMPAHEAVEGFYLKGQGVIFSASLAVLAHDIKPSAALVVKPVSEWDRVRKEMNGERVDPAATAAVKKHDSVADVVLKLLAENGHNFTQLPQTEQVTVAVTLRRAQQCTACHVAINFHGTQVPGASSLFNSNHPWRDMSPGARSNAPSNAAVNQGGVADFRNTTGTAAQSSAQQARDKGLAYLGAEVSGALRVADENAQVHKTEQQNLVLLGDLQMKQGRYKEAIAAYHKAYEEQQKSHPQGVVGELASTMKNDDPRLQQHVSSLELATKWAQAALAAGDQDEAARALKNITDSSTRVDASLKKWIEARARPARPAQGPRRQSGVLPNKLIISAPKRLLDQVGAGKISFEEFKKGVSVHHVEYSPD